MALFGKKLNDLSNQRKKGFTNVIKNEGDSQLLVWRHPDEDFNTDSTLIVMPGERAVFIKEGVIEQEFDNGTYRLSTNNYPFIGKLRRTVSGGESIFSCVIYFIKKSISIEVGWGTSSPIQVRDKKLNIATQLKANGGYKVRIKDYGIFIEKLMGSNVYAMLPNDLDNYFFNEFQGKIRTAIAKVIEDSDREILGIDSRTDEITGLVTPFIQRIFNEYGIECINFSIAEIIIADSKLREKYDEIYMSMHEQRLQGDVTAENTIKQGNAEVQVKMQQALAEAQIMIAQGKAQKEVMDILGNAGWAKQQAAIILEKLASNTGSGGIAAAGAGLGMGMAAMGPFANLADTMISPLTNAGAMSDSNRDKVNSDRFEEATNVREDIDTALTKLKGLYDKGLITKDDYNAKKEEILGRL